MNLSGGLTNAPRSAGFRKTCSPRQPFVVGMRVVLADGDWEWPAAAGHYGKVTAVRPAGDEDDPPIRVEITGHVSGAAPDAEMAEYEWFWPEELTVVD